MLSSLARRAPSSSIARAFSTSTKFGSNSSTSAADYKLAHPSRRPPALPTTEPNSWTAEEAVNNILYNTPPVSKAPYTRHTLNCLVQNEPGVLARVSGALAARGFNIDSLIVCATEISDLSRMCIVLRGQASIIEQARRQLEDLVPVWAVLDYTHTKVIERELLLAKISILGPEYFEDQLLNKSGILAATSGLEPNSPAKQHADNTAKAASSSHPAISEHLPTHDKPLTASEALRQKGLHLGAIETMAKMFGGKVVDLSHNAVIVEISGKTERVDAFLKLVRPYGILEAARSGAMVMPRAPIASPWQGMADAEEPVEESEGVDSSLLPPG